jgi:hypothetical protein
MQHHGVWQDLCTHETFFQRFDQLLDVDKDELSMKD